MTPEQQQEEISKAYLHAIAAQCGYAVGNWTQDHGCLDATLGAPSRVGAGHLAKPKLDLQLKATRRTDVEHTDHIAWSLDAAHYASLIADSSAPHLLVILLLPEDHGQTIEHTVDHLLIRRCAYWVTMTGMAAITNGAGSCTVHLPKSQPFSPTELHRIMELVSQGKRP